VGGGTEGFRKSISANLRGVAVASVALLAITTVNPGLPGPLWPSIVVGITAGILVLGAKIEAFSVIPATVDGYASTAGYGLLSGVSVTEANITNPLVCVALALVIGARF
jgi:fructose 1,6-bisphosphatase